jgi:hypothetical protein
MGDFGEASFSSSFTSSPSFFAVVFPSVGAGMSVAVVSFDPTPPPRPQLAKRLEGEGIDGNWTLANTNEEEEEVE